MSAAPPTTSVTQLPTIISWAPKLRYWARHITGSRSGSSSVEVPGCGTQANAVRPQSSDSNSATPMLVGPENVELAALSQSTLNSQISTKSWLGSALPPL